MVIFRKLKLSTCRDEPEPEIMKVVRRETFVSMKKFVARMREKNNFREKKMGRGAIVEFQRKDKGR